MLGAIFIFFVLAGSSEGMLEFQDQTAPSTFDVIFETTVKNGTTGKIRVHVERQWSPLGVDRFYTLLKLSPESYYDQNAFFRVVTGYIVQFGINGDPTVSSAWEFNTIKDDPLVISNKKGTLVFATAGPNTRTTQLFLNYVDNVDLDSQGFTPFGKVVNEAGMATALAINAQYGQDPVQTAIYNQGNFYLKSTYPNLDYVVKTTIVDEKIE